MTYPPEDYKPKRKVFLTWSFAIAILTTILVYSIINELIICITNWLH